MDKLIDKFWVRIRFSEQTIIDRFFSEYSHMNNFIRKHNISDNDIIFIRTNRKQSKKF